MLWSHKQITWPVSLCQLTVCFFQSSSSLFLFLKKNPSSPILHQPPSLAPSCNTDKITHISTWEEGAFSNHRESDHVDVKHFQFLLTSVVVGILSSLQDMQRAHFSNMRLKKFLILYQLGLAILLG